MEGPTCLTHNGKIDSSIAKITEGRKRIKRGGSIVSDIDKRFRALEERVKKLEGDVEQLKSDLRRAL